MVHTAVQGSQEDFPLEHQLSADQFGISTADIRLYPQNLRHRRLAAREIQLILKLKALFRYRYGKIPFCLLLFLLHQSGLQHTAGNHHRFHPVRTHSNLIVYPNQHLSGIDGLGLRRQDPRNGHHTALGCQSLLVCTTLKFQFRPQAVDFPAVFRKIQNTAPNPSGKGQRPLRCLPGIQAADARGIQQLGNIRVGVRHNHFHGFLSGDLCMENQIMIWQRGSIQL